jgi:hypothetical protein
MDGDVGLISSVWSQGEWVSIIVDFDMPASDPTAFDPRKRDMM